MKRLRPIDRTVTDIDEDRIAGRVSVISCRDGLFGPATFVGLEFVGEAGTVVAPLDSPEAVDKLIQGLLRHKRDVWPEAE